MATISVRLADTLGRPVDGTVTLQRSGFKAFSCHTVASRCTISGIPAGTYTATVRPRRGAAPPPRSFAVPSDRARLVFSASIPPLSAPAVTRGARVARELARLRVENMILKARLRRCR